MKPADVFLSSVRVAVAMEVAESGTSDIVVSPAGKVTSTNGTFVMDAAAWREIEKAYRQRNIQLPVDYEHQTVPGMNARADGLAPRAGSIKALRFEEGAGLIATVEWTQKAREMIRAGEYKYPSPVVLIRKSDQRAVELVSVGLTNDPAIFGIGALAATRQGNASRKYREAHSMDATQGTTAPSDPAVLIGEMAGYLGIATDGKEMIGILTEMRDKMKSGKGDGEEKKDDEDKKVASSARTALGLSGDAGSDAVVLALTNLKASKKNEDALLARINSLEASSVERDFDLFIAPYKAKGAVSEANKAQYEMLKRSFKSNRDDCKIICDGLPHPKQEQLTDGAPAKTGKVDRATMIANAAREFAADPSIGKVTSLKAFTNMKLGDAGRELLSDDEVKKLVA